MLGIKPNISELPTVNTEENTGGKTTEQTTSSSTDAPVSEITAKVDLNRKPESARETINLLDDAELDRDVTGKTEGDIKKEQEGEKKKPNLNAFRDQTGNIPSQPSANGEVFNPTLAQQQSEAWVKIIDMVARFALKAWSGQADNVGLEVSEKDKETLAQQIAIALSEYKVVVPILLTIATTVGAMYATPILNARESKKKIDEFRAQQKAEEAKRNPKVKPEFDPDTGKHKKGKGRFFKT